MNNTNDRNTQVEEAFSMMGLASEQDRQRFQLQSYDNDYSQAPAAEIFMSQHT